MNMIVASILYKARPDEVKLIMIDPKVVECNVYNGIPHLIIPVVTDPKKAANALSWVVREMEERYGVFAETGTRDLRGYNEHAARKNEQPLPQIVVIIDELADLMMTSRAEVETSICRIAQKARAAGIHLVIATQRPSADVITGLIKTNVPSRLALAVASHIDSRVILDMNGAEKLLGNGDMLFSPAGINKPQRIQGAYISDSEVESLVSFVKAGTEAEYDPTMVEKITSNTKLNEVGDDDDEFFEEAVEFLLEKERGSVSMLQRRFRIGYNRAARLMETLESRGIVGPEDGVKPRKVLITRFEWEEYREK
jgi:S-DNA-T family DNA segregation ATPase FtsK/SpoIIIE